MSRDTPLPLVRSRYRQLIRSLHPDSSPESDAIFRDGFPPLKAAFEQIVTELAKPSLPPPVASQAFGDDLLFAPPNATPPPASDLSVHSKRPRRSLSFDWRVIAASVAPLVVQQAAARWTPIEPPLWMGLVALAAILGFAVRYRWSWARTLTVSLIVQALMAVTLVVLGVVWLRFSRQTRESGVSDPQ